MNPVKDKVEIISKKIEELIKDQFTGSITLNYNFLDGRLMGVAFSTREQITKGSELININNFVDS